MRITVGLLGPFVLRVDGEVLRVPSERLRALTAALAVDAGRVVGTDTLAERVWGEKMPARPRPSLQTLVNRLRGLLGADTVRTEGDGYLLDLPAEAVDVLSMQRLAERARAQPAAQARATLAEALELWRGEPFLGAGSETLRAEAGPPIVERYLAALERRVDIDLAAEAHADVVTELRELVGAHPLREPLWARLMTALHRSGRQAEALQAYQVVRVRLAEEFGVDPSAELQRTYVGILAEDEPLEPSTVDRVASTEDQSAPDIKRVPRQLPPDINGFTARDAELSEMDAALSDTRLVAVHGPGGVGKTSLALRWARRRIEEHGEFGDGQLYLDMRGYGPGEPVPATEALDVVLRAVGVPPTQIPAGVDERSALLRTRLAGGRSLLVLDNVRDAGQVRPLLPGGANTVLVTSRSELNGLAVRDGAARVNLRELSPADSVRLLARSVGTARTDAEPDASTELARLCGGLPLALVIAAQQAARYPDAPLADSVYELRADTRLDALGDPSDPAVDPRAVFSWSYRALADDAARAFRRLGLHPAPRIALPATVAVLGLPRPTVRRLLDALVSVHLLERDGREDYRFHDLLREYAAERAAEEEPAEQVEATVRRTLDWYLLSLRAARHTTFAEMPFDSPEPAPGVEPLTFADHREATAWFDATRPTLLAVLDYATEHGHHRHGWQSALLMRNFFAIRHRRDDQLRVAGQAVECAGNSGDDVARAFAYHAYGAALDEGGDRGSAMIWHERTLELARRIGLHAILANTMVSIALIRLTYTVDGKPDFGGALELLHQAVVEAERSALPAHEAHALLNLGSVAGMAGLLDESIRHSEQSLRLYRSLGSEYYQAFALGNLAEAHHDRGDYADALRYADEALGLLGDVDDRLAASGTLAVKGRVLLAVGEHAAARRAWQRALRILRDAEDPQAEEIVALLADLDSQESAQRSR